MDTEVRSFKDLAQGKCDVNVKLAENLEKHKKKLKQAKIEFNDANCVVEQKTLENLNLQKKIITLADATLIQKKSVEDLTRECVKLYMMVDDTQCKLFRAQMVSSHEEANVNKYLPSMEEFKMTVQLEAGARAKQLHDQSEWKSKLVVLIDRQQEELEQKNKQLVEKEKELDGLYQKNLMLKKHNEARLLRLKKQVEKAEAHHVLLEQQRISK